LPESNERLVPLPIPVRVRDDVSCDQSVRIAEMKSRGRGEIHRGLRVDASTARYRLMPPVVGR
jgi:hypothetical protein